MKKTLIIRNQETTDKVEKLKGVYNEKTASKTIDKIVELDYNKHFTK